MPAESCYFITGYPGFIGRWVVSSLFKKYPKSKFYILVQEDMKQKAQEALKQYSRAKQKRVTLITGDVTHLHMGLSSEEMKILTHEVTDVFHLAAVHSFKASRDRVFLVNVRGTENALELARKMKNLKRFNHFSTIHVSGDRTGVIMEDELDKGQHLRNDYEASKFMAEVKVERAKKNLPITIFRPGVVVGDSKTGAIDRIDGLYSLSLFILLAPAALPLPLPGPGSAPMSMVPVDYLADAVVHLAHLPAAKGETIHLVDPNPISTGRIYEILSKHLHRKPSAIRMPRILSKALLKVPAFGKTASTQVIDYLNHLAFYNSQSAQRLLKGSKLTCPAFEDYAPVMANFVAQSFSKRKSRAFKPLLLFDEDPLD